MLSHYIIILENIENSNNYVGIKCQNNRTVWHTIMGSAAGHHYHHWRFG